MSLAGAKQVLENKELKAFVLSDKGKLNFAEYIADGAINPELPLAVLTKGSAGAYTLAAPAADQDGHELKIVTATAFAHVVTATDLLDDGVTGGPKDTYTFAAFVGGSISLMALNGRWVVLNKNLGTTAAV